MSSSAQKYLVAYSGVLTLVFAVVVLTGAAATRSEKFDIIDVQRINVREPDGTLRMVLSNKTAFPGAIFGDREYTHPRPMAGMIFYNDEGMENGGLIFNGSRDDAGNTNSGGHLSFDPYDRDQALSLTQIEEDGTVRAALQINDTGTTSIESMFREMERIKTLPEADRDEAMEALGSQSDTGARRLFVGKNDKQASVIALSDASGKPRLLLRVKPEGGASIEFLDANGEVQRTLVPEDLKTQ